MSSSQQSRNWVFTLNNYTRHDLTALEPLKDQMDYYIVGKEVGESGTKHLQGYIVFSKNRRLSALKKLYPKAHFEIRKGSHQEASDYCKKDNDYVEHNPEYSPKQGKRTDIEVARQVLKETGRVRDVVEVATSHQSIRTAEVLCKYIEKKRTTKPYVIWYYGPPGSGKSRSAFEEAETEFPDNYWVSSRNLKWWEGYDAHPCVIIDDYRKDFCTFHELLRILDRYEYRVEVKGSSRQLLAEKIYITCPYSPEQLYADRSDEDLTQLTRRIDLIKNFDTL